MLIRRQPEASATAAVVRRSPVVSPKTEAGKERYYGTLTMRRVERVDSLLEPHWYVCTLTDQDAVNLLARRMGIPRSQLHCVGHMEPQNG